MSVFAECSESQIKQLLESGRLLIQSSTDEQIIEHEKLLSSASKYEQAAIALILGKLQKAKLLFQQVVEESSETADYAWVELVLLDPMEYHLDQSAIKKLRSFSKNSGSRLSARALHALSILYLWNGLYAKAFDAALSCMEYYQAKNEVQGKAFISDTMGSLCVSIGDSDRALLYYTQSLAFKFKLKDDLGVALTLGNLARLCFQLGRFSQAREFALQDLSIISTVENVELSKQSMLMNLLARIELADNNFSQAEFWLSKASDNIGSTNKKDFFILKDLALVNLAQHKLEKAHDYLEEAKKVLPEASAYHEMWWKLVRLTYLFAQLSGPQRIQSSEYTELMLSLDELIQLHSIPEVTIQFYLLKAKDSYVLNQSADARDFLLLANKLMKHSQQLRFQAEIQKYMMEWEFSESITEEVAKAIDTQVTNESGYIIRKSLGEGGFGTVSLAWDVEREQNVALKQFKSNAQLTKKEQDRLWHQARIEFEAAARINSPSIAKPIAIGHDSFGLPYVVHQYIEGQKLTQFMQAITDNASIVQYMIQIAQAMEFIHAEGIIHRDLKPDNIMINASGSPVIIDLGIALFSHFKSSASIAGTENYMAPEQKLSLEIDQRADIYSLGCIFYQWIAKTLPEAITNNDSSLLDKIIRKQKTGININTTEIPSGLIELISSMVAVKPENRPGNLEDCITQMRRLKL
ncbi:MAG: protein kinase [Gammaproteobacteria bacterium]|nr:protein kinase [Gammaproteobacteria bacterium]